MNKSLLKAANYTLHVTQTTLSNVIFMSVQYAIIRALQTLKKFTSFTNLKSCIRVHLYEGPSVNYYTFFLKIWLPEELM